MTAATHALAIMLTCSAVAAGCGGDDEAATTPAPATAAVTTGTTTTASASPSSYTVDVWADNWMAVYVDGEKIGEDSVPITTERSFNAERFTFEATPPFTVGIEAKDFKETDSGIEYIGQPKQQMGDGGLIAQVIDDATGEVVAATDADTRVLVVQRAPLNPECEKDPDPDATCRSETAKVPDGWSEDDFDDGQWKATTEYTAAEVGPKDGYDTIDWDAAATLVWGDDLKVDNTVLFRLPVS